MLLNVDVSIADKTGSAHIGSSCPGENLKYDPMYGSNAHNWLKEHSLKICKGCIPHTGMEADNADDDKKYEYGRAEIAKYKFSLRCTVKSGLGTQGLQVVSQHGVQSQEPLCVDCTLLNPV